MKSLLDVFPDADSLFQQTRASPLKFASARCTAFKKKEKESTSGTALLFQNYANSPLKCDVVTGAPPW